MKTINKIANIAFGLVFIGSSVFAQSLADAKKAIDAEQYQKAKGMLKNLTVTQAASQNNDENLFYLGWVYVLQDYTDSAKTCFTKGINANAKSALNYVGLGVVSLVNKDISGASTNFNQAISLTSKKDSKPYLYIGRGYLLGAVDGKLSATDANAAIDVLNKGKAANPKDPEIFLELGNAYRSQLKSNDAYENYEAALALDPKSPAANTAEGVLWRYAQNFTDSEKQLHAAIAIDPNYGPAYRELAETDLTESYDFVQKKDGPGATAKIKEGVENYKKFLSLTDQSIESLLRYADFLVSLGDYTTLQEVTTSLSKSANSNARVYRYLGYAAYENKDYAAGIKAMNTWFAKAGANRILPRDYLYLGRLQIASGQDTTAGIATLKKAVDLDSTRAEAVYGDIANIYKHKSDYLGAANTYEALISKVPGKPLLTEHFYEGFYYYFAFNKTSDTTLLVKADSALSYVIQKTNPKPFADAVLYRARIADIKDVDRNNIKGLAKPFYEQYIELMLTKVNPDARTKSNIAEAYAYLGNYVQYKEKDEAKALDYFTKAQAVDPTNKQVIYYFSQKGAKK